MSNTTRYEILIKIGDEKYYLDTFQYDPVSLNFDIANIKDISGRNSAYSKTIKLPDSQNNREVLGFITNLSVDSSVDANKAIKTWILVDTIPVFEGNLQLKKFQKNFKTGEFDIEVVVFADNDTFFTTIGEKYISDLDLSEYNHDWIAANIRFSWTQSTGFPYRYPLIDYGSNWNISDLNGLTFSGATQGTATQSLTVDEMFPAISRKIIFDRIFQEAGFNYDSEFLNSDYFKNEYIPFSGVKMPGRSDADQLTFKAAGTQSQIILTAPTSGGQSGITDEIIDAVDFEDTNNFWDSTNYWYENTTNDIISMSFDILVKYKMLLPQGATRIRVWSSLNADGSANANWAGGTGRLIASSLALYSNGSIISNTVLDPPDTYTSFYTTPYINIRSGEKVRFTLYALNQVYVPNLNFIELQLSNISNNINPFATVGSSLQISNLLPKKIKQRDFILSACREYNLYIEPSKEYQNTLIIEPRDDYYAKGRIKDWTSKLDMNQPIEVDILAETQNKITTFTHKEDKDYLNQNYKQSFNEIYGQYDFDSGNEFAKSQNKKIESIFSPTPLNLVPDSVGLIIPLITKDTLFSYNVDSKGRLDTNIRTLQWGGLVEFNNDFDRISFDGEYITNNGRYAYPYAGHLDNPYNPTVDNNFGDPIDVYFPNNGLTTNNLFNRFWYKTMFELTNKDSRIVTANFFLTAEDIYNFRFNDKIYIFLDGNGQYYKVNKIFDFDPGTSKTTKVELLRTFDVEVNTFKPKFIGKGKGGVRVPPRGEIQVDGIKTETLDTGNNNTIDGVQILTNGSSNDVSGVGILINGNNNVVEVSGTNQIVNGNRNQIDLGVSDSTIFGNDNKIGTYSEGVTIFGNRNEVYGASGSTPSNIFVIGNDIVATQSNTNYIGGNTIFSGTVSFEGGSISGIGLQDVLDYDNDVRDTKLYILSDNSVVFTKDTFTFSLYNAPSSFILNSDNSSIGSPDFASNQSFNAIFNSEAAYITYSNNTTILNSKFAYISGGYGSGIIYSENSRIESTDPSPLSGVERSVIIGGEYNKLNSNDIALLYTSIIGGNRNTIDSGTLSAYPPGSESSDNSLIFGGEFNRIQRSSNSGILNSKDSYIIDSNNATTIGSDNATMSKSQFVMSSGDIDVNISNSQKILSQSNERIFISDVANSVFLNNDVIAPSGTFSFNNLVNTTIISCNSFTASSCTSSIAIGSSLSIMQNVNRASMFGGSGNRISQVLNCNMIASENSSLTYSTNSLILGGRNNKLSSPGSGQGGLWGDAAIIGGINNTIDFGGGWSTILGGDTNSISGFYSVVAGGAVNDIGLTYGTGNYSFVGGGQFNKIFSTDTEPTSRNSGIIGGFQNKIKGVRQFIAGGSDNTINQGATNSIIIGGRNNTISSNIQNTTIINGITITATESNTLYTDIVRNTYDKYYGDSTPTNLLVTQRSGWTYSYDIGLMGGRVEVQVGTVPGGANTIIFGIAPDNNQCRKFYATVTPASSNAVGLGIWVDDSYFTPNELAAYVRWTTAPTTGETYKFNVTINPLY